MLISAGGIFVGFITIAIGITCFNVNSYRKIEFTLKCMIGISTLLMTPVVFGLAYTTLPPVFKFNVSGIEASRIGAAISVICGLWSGMIIGFVTEY